MNCHDKEFLENLIGNIDIHSPLSSTFKIRHLFRFLLKENEDLKNRVACLEKTILTKYDEEQ